MSEAAYTPEDPLIGQMVDGRYRIARRIAEGGMATVYEALDTRLGRTVAIKVMHTQLAQGPHRAQFVERFRREATSAAAIANPHIVQVYDTGEVNGLDFLVMEFVHGVNLRREMNEQGTFTVRETLRVVAETLDGLASAHRAGVVHRDIKPENILLNDRGHVQITDFGLAKAASQATLSSTGMLLGTAAYLAPEMIEYNQATPQGDLYSVGIMAWEMLAGEVPFVSDNPVTLVFKHVHEDVPSISTVCPGISPLVSAFIAHLTARGVDARPADAAEAEQELHRMTAQLDAAAWMYRRTKPVTDGDAADGRPVTGLAALSGTAAFDIPEPPLPPAPEQSAETDVSATGITASDSDADAMTNPLMNAPDAATVSSDVTATQAFDRANDGTSPTAAFAAPQEAATQTLPATPLASVADLPQDEAGPGHAHPTRHSPAAHTSGTVAPRSKMPFIIAAIALLTIVMVAGGASWWYFLGPGSYWTVPKPDDVTCAADNPCSIAGAKWSAYRSTLNVSNIPFTVSERNDDTMPEGSIISAEPGNVGDRIGKRNGDTMSIIVSKGVKTATVPSDILDASSANGKDVLTALKTAGFDNVSHDTGKDEYSETLPEGAALSITDADGQAIQPGAVLKHNDAITVALSKGPMPVNMPGIVGKTRQEAEAALADLKLTANITEAYDDKVETGVVVSASQQEGASLHWGDSVDVVVSKGPEKATIPSGLVGKQASDVTKTLKALGFDVKTERVLGGLFGTVRSIKNGNTDISDGAEVRLRDENGKATVITLTVV